MEKMGRVTCVLYLFDFDLGVQTDYYRCITKHPLATPKNPKVTSLCCWDKSITTALPTKLCEIQLLFALCVGRSVCYYSSHNTF